MVMVGERTMDDMVAAKVHIRKNDTGEIRVYDSDLFLEDGFPSVYIWEEGNYSCDCNRRLIFARVNDDDDEDWESGCGETEYSVNVFVDGKLIYFEFDNITVSAHDTPI